MATTSATMLPSILPSQKDSEDLAEYTKILKLRDDVFAGNHPRLTVPAQFRKKVSPASTKSANVSEPVQIRPVVHQFPGLGVPHEEQDEESPLQSGTYTPTPNTATASGINPVLLTKSDDLVRAENQIKRQRLERLLRDQFEKKRLDFRKFPNPAEAKPDFDIPTLLANAKEAAASINVSDDANSKGDDSDSVDENSFYSSRAPDSTPDGALRSPCSQGQEFAAKVDANGLAAPALSLSQPTGPMPHPRPSSRTAGDRPAAIATNGLPSRAAVVEADDEDEEGEYSPPETTNDYPIQNDESAHTIPDIRNRPVRRYSDLDHNGKRAASPSDGSMRIERPFKDDRHRGRANSPSQSPETIQQRNKRRKIERKNDKRNRRNGIKQENVSPPPFHEITPLGQGKVPQPDGRPLLIPDPLSPQEVRYVQAAPRYIESPVRPTSQQAEFIPLSEPRVLSRTAMRPRDDQDLRKVASLHNLRAEQPREYAEYITPTRLNASSYIRVDSPMREVSQDRRMEYNQPAQEVRIIRTPAPGYREAYSAQPEVRYIQEPGPASVTERIVVDQYGRRFREIVEERASVAPRAASQTYVDRQLPPSYDPATRIRAPSVMVEERPQPRFVQENMPPPMTRQTFHSTAPVARDMYASSEADSIQTMDRVPRQVIYADRPPQMRELTRFESLRPSSVQYNGRMPTQTVSRAGSVRPDYEHMVDRATVGRDNVLAQQPRYRVVEAEPQLLYVDQYGREIPPLQETREIRYVSQY